MRSVWLCTLFGMALAAVGMGQVAASTLTVVLDFQSSSAPRAVEEMKREAETILAGAGVSLQWVDRKRAQGVFDDLAVFRFHGPCAAQPWNNRVFEEGALAFTHVSNGVVLPFSEVDCDRIAAALQTAIRGVPPERSELLLGRAMGRVVAHELVHILSHSEHHARSGVTMPALSENDLIMDRLPLAVTEHLYVPPEASTQVAH